ncbi:hypothetical protein AUJ84_04145 [Candidatus Pacearchaeota archaeon CG1_02_32_132]|nr:MAG: hypothetical protein AUJ84_04145 [Candidatus Pacearchaeota archaeon CG1_02_32_132]
MIKEFEDIRYKFEEQKVRYTSISNKFSFEDKKKIIETILEEDIWAYFQLAVEILFEFCSDTKEYINLLERTYNKIKNDMASAPFFEMLIRIGKEKPSIGLAIYKEINQNSNSDELKTISGLILGGYSIKENNLLNKLIGERKIEYPLTNLTLKAILVKYENENAIPEEVKSFIEYVSNSEEEKHLRELMNLCIFLYKLDNNYFYDIIKKIMEKKNSRVNEMIFIRCKRLNFSSKQFIELAELTKDCDEHALNELMHSFIDYPEEVENISELFIYWVNKNLEFKIINFDWTLKELAKKNKKFIEYFIDNYSKIQTEKLSYFHLFPRMFERLASEDISFAIKILIIKKVWEKDLRLFFELVSKIIGDIYKLSDKNKAFDLFLPLANVIESISEGSDFVNYDKDNFNKIIQTKNFDELINYVNYLLDALRFRKNKYNFEEIDKSLEEFKELNYVVKTTLDKIKKEKRYSPLFWLGEQERDKELKKAYLEELNQYLNLTSDIVNEECSENNRSLINNLSDESGFFDVFSEVLFINKFVVLKSKYSLVIEPKIPNKRGYSDLLVQNKQRKFFFEVKNSKTDRNLSLDNGAVLIKNRVDKIIKEKSKQFFDEKTFKEMEDGKRTDLYFIVIDADNSTIDEYMIANSFFGSLAYQFYRNNKTGETTEPQLVRNDDAIAKDKKIVSGLIYFKKQLINKDGKIKFILVGDIIVNPYAVNQPTKEEVEELKKILFSA